MKILFLIVNANIINTTAFIEIVKTLVLKGSEMHIVLSSKSNESMIEEYYLGQPAISIEVLETRKSERKEVRFLKNFIRKNRTIEKVCTYGYEFIEHLKFWMISRKKNYGIFLSEPMKNFSIKEKYDYMWVTDETGLLWAKWINNHSKREYKIVYHCLELYWEHYCFPQEKKWCFLNQYMLFEEARQVLESVFLIIIQDVNRWKVLCKYTGLKENTNKVLLPLSIRDYSITSKGLLYSNWNISKNKKIIFYPTLLAPKRGCEELMKVSTYLPDDFITVIHGFEARAGYIDRLEKYSKKSEKVRVSHSSLEYKKLLDIHKDIWCVFLCYGEADNNDRYIANSSNKLVMSLWAGKPILTLGNQMLAELCNEYGCGKSLNSWSKSDFLDAVNDLEMNYEKYSYNARRCYEKRFNIELYSENLYNKLSTGVGEKKND